MIKSIISALPSPATKGLLFIVAGICGIILSFLLTIEVSKTLMIGLVFITLY